MTRPSLRSYAICFGFVAIPFALAVYEMTLAPCAGASLLAVVLIACRWCARRWHNVYGNAS